VFAVDSTLLSYPVMRQDTDSFGFSITGGVSKTDAWISAAILQSSNIHKEKKRCQGQSPFCYHFVLEIIRLLDQRPG